MDVRKGALRAAAAALLIPASTMMILLILTGAAGANMPPPLGCAGGGSGQTVANVKLDAEQMGNAHTIVTVTAGRHLPAYAAVVAIATAYQESRLHNSTRQSDHDSEGLFQQRVSIYTKAVADDPVKATNAFLDRLIGVPNWQSIPLTVAAQTVQISESPNAYAQWQALAQGVVGQLWPAAAAAAGPAPTTSGSGLAGTPAPSTPSVVCSGGGGAVPIGGGHGNNIAGTTVIPAGLVIDGSPGGIKAVQYGLAQLGKPYAFGAAGPDAFDCSGLTMTAWAAAGVALPHWTITQATQGTPEPTNLSQAVAGDLVFIPGSDGTPQAPGHVGMIAGYVDTGHGRRLFILHAPMAGIPVELTEAHQWGGQIVAVRHIK
jgi:cell wall-associated NlpC family hydrolase